MVGVTPQTGRTGTNSPARQMGVPPVAGVGAALPVRQRRPGLAALTLVMIAVLAAFAGWLYQQAGEKTPVVVMAQRVPQGHPIERADLSSVAVAGGISAVAADGVDELVGMRAEVDLLPGTVLQRSMISDAPLLPESKAHVGVAVGPGQLPADGLEPGDTVQVLQLPADTGAAPGDTPAVLAGRADVYSVREDVAEAGGALLTLVVPRTAAAVVAAASDAKRVALIQVSDQVPEAGS
jgi:hypothetical protein